MIKTPKLFLEMGPSILSPSLKLSVIIPIFNEEASIREVVDGVFAHFKESEVIVVDDGSTDRGAEMARQGGATVLRHPYNLGNGAAIKSGIRKASGDVLVFMDGDGQHRPEDIARLLKEIDHYAMVVGQRDGQGQANVGRSLANKIFNGLASYVCRFPILDLTSGFRAIRAPLAKQYVYLLPNTFSYPSTITLATIKSGHPVCYVPIQVKPRVGQSKIKAVRDGVRFFVIILKITMLFSPLRIFLPVSLMFVGSALGNYAYTFYYFHRFTNMSVLLAFSGVLVFMLGLIAEQIALLRMDRTEDGT